MTETVLFSLIFIWIKGYKWRDIFKLFKHWSVYPIVLTCCLHIYLIYLVIHNEYWFLEYSKHIKITSFLFYFILIWKYKLIDTSIFKKINEGETKLLIWLTSPMTIGSLFILIGTILNKTAMYFNGNKMPVFISNSWATGYAKNDIFIKALKYGDFHIIGNEFTKVIPLCDTWDFGWCSMSIGDMIVRTFVVLIIYYSVKACNN